MQTQPKNDEAPAPQLELQHVVDYIKRVALSKPYDSDLQRICKIAEEGIIAAEEAKNDLGGMLTEKDLRMRAAWAFDGLRAFLSVAYRSVILPSS